MAALIVIAGSLAGCSSTVDLIPTWAGGLPAGAPERPATRPEYPAVNEPPSARHEAPLTLDEENRLRAELTTLRNHQEGVTHADPAKPPPSAAKPAPAKQAATKPAKKSKGPMDLKDIAESKK